MKKLWALFVGIGAFVSAILIASSALAAGGTTIYDSTVSPLPGNLPSVGGEAYAFSELGDRVTFAGTARTLNDVTVTLSSWGCEAGHWYNGDCATTPGATFSVPITLNIYNADPGDAVGTLITSVTSSFAIPYRPSASVSCGDGRWSDGTSCFNGLANNVTFNLLSAGITLPNSVVFGISYNTSHYGPSPIGEAAACYSSSGGCGYDSLNIALSPSVVVGSKPFPDTLYWNNSHAPNYCDGGVTGTFRLDSPSSACWSGYVPAVRFTAVSVAANADDCKKGGWENLIRADGSSFKNQGDCVSYTNNAR